MEQILRCAANCHGCWGQSIAEDGPQPPLPGLPPRAANTLAPKTVRVTAPPFLVVVDFDRVCPLSPASATTSHACSCSNSHRKKTPSSLCRSQSRRNPHRGTIDRHSLIALRLYFVPVQQVAAAGPPDAVASDVRSGLGDLLALTFEVVRMGRYDTITERVLMEDALSTAKTFGVQAIKVALHVDASFPGRCLGEEARLMPPS